MSSTSPQSTHSHSSEALLEHLGWIRDLAHRLCEDSGLADDVGQDVAMSLLENPPAEGVSVRAWARTVLGNLLRQRRREARRRSEREERVAVDERQAATAELVARASVQRQIVGAVLELREPYRGTVLQRYFEGRMPGQIAKLESVSVETVKTRLKRAHDQLRQRLDADCNDDRRSWSLALLTAFPLQPRASSAAGVGASIMTAKFLVPAGLALAAILGFQSLRERGLNTPAIAAAPVEHPEPEPVPVNALPKYEFAQAPTENESRVRVATSEQAETEPREAVPSREADLAALVIDLDSRPTPNVEVRLIRPGTSVEVGEVLGTTNAHGYLRTHVALTAGFLRVDSAAWTTVFEGSLQGIGASETATIVVAPPRDVGGRVVDVSGAPVPGCKVELFTTAPLGTRLNVAVNAATGATFEASTDESGSFLFLAVPELPGSSLRARKAGYTLTEQTVEDLGPIYTTLVFEEETDVEGLLFGQVLDAAGSPVEGAWVSLGGDSQTTDAGGRFGIPRSGTWVGDTIQAVLVGYLPGEVHKCGDGTWPDPLILTLGHSPVELAGIVVYDNGAPAPGVRVKLHSSTPFGFVAQDEPQPGGWLLNSGGSSNQFRRSVEDLVGGPDGVRETATNGAGHFRLTGLLERDYLLVLNEPATLLGNTSRWVRAGAQEVRVVLQRTVIRDRIAGRVTNELGEPVPQVAIALQRNIAADYGDFPIASLMGSKTSSDDDGRFEFGPAATGGLMLSVRPGAGYQSQYLSLEGYEDLDEIEVVLAGVANFYVDLGLQADLADSMQLLDEEGTALFLHTARGLGGFAVDEGGFADGRTPVYSATAGQCTVVLLKAGSEVGRREVTLQPGQTTAIDF